MPYFFCLTMTSMDYLNVRKEFNVFFFHFGYIEHGFIICNLSEMCTKFVTQLCSYLYMSPHICVSADVIIFSLTTFSCFHPLPNLVKFLVFDKMEEPTPRKTHNSIRNLNQHQGRNGRTIQSTHKKSTTNTSITYAMRTNKIGIMGDCNKEPRKM